MKSIKVFYNGKRLRDIYPHATRWEVIKWKAKRLIRKIFITSTVLAILYLSITVGGSMFPNTVYSVQEKQIVVDSLGQKIEEIKQTALDELEKCESAGHSEDDGIIIFDSNDKASIGQYQFQKATVAHYYQVLYGEKITGKQSVEIALDKTKARKLAYDIIFKTENGLKNWINCSNKIELRNTLEIIKTLEK